MGDRAELAHGAQRVSEIGRLLHSVANRDELWSAVRQQFPRFLDRFYVHETQTVGGGLGELLLGYEAGRLKGALCGSDVEASVTFPERVVVHPFWLDTNKAGCVTFDLDAHSDWLSQEELVAHLESALARARECERLERARQLERALVSSDRWGEPQQTRLGLVARFIKESLRCDVVVIYPLYQGRFPVKGIDPAIAGELRHPEAMLSQVKPGDAVNKLLAFGDSIYIDDTGFDHEFLSWFHRRGRKGFQEREQIRALSGHVLRWGPQNSVVGVMFCNYRQPESTAQTARFCRRLADHAALALHQELSDYETLRPPSIPPA